jgi:hypothetical protein
MKTLCLAFVGFLLLAASCNPPAPSTNRYISARMVCPETEKPVPSPAQARGLDMAVRQRYCCGLDEGDCRSASMCTTVERTLGCYEDGVCDEEVGFIGCNAITDSVIDDVARRKELCGGSGGKWRNGGEVIDRHCQCPTAPDPDGGPTQLGLLTRAGCMTAEQACVAGGGLWAPPKVLRKGTTQVRYPDGCVRSRTGITSKWNPSGTSWNGEKGTCEVVFDRRRCHFRGRELTETADILALVPALKKP